MKIRFAVATSLSALALAIALAPVAGADDTPLALGESWAQANDSLNASGSAANDRSLAVTTGDVQVPLNGIAATKGASALHNQGVIVDRGGVIDNDGFDLDLSVGALAVSLGMTTATLRDVTVLPLGTEIGFQTGQFFNVTMHNSNGVNVINANTGIASQANHIGFAAIVK